MNVYISSENNNIFVNQRKYTLKKFLPERKKENNIFLFTEDLSSLNKLNLIIKKKKFNKIYIVDKVVNFHRFQEYLNKNYLYFNFIFFFKRFIFNLKYIILFKNLKSIFLNFHLIYIFIEKKDKRLSITGNKKFNIFYSKPYFEKKNIKLVSLKKEKIKTNFTIYFDSAFPLHPDLIGVNKKLPNTSFNKKFIFEYLNYLKRIFYSKKKVAVFLAPRTFEAVNKNKVYKKLIINYSKKFFFLKGINSYLSIKKKKREIFSQVGGQLNYFEANKNLYRIKIIEFDKTFKNFFYKLNRLEHNKRNSNFINNYNSIFFKFSSKSKN